MVYNKRERECYNNHRTAVCELLGITKNQYNWFRREGEKLRKIYENDCNGLYESEEAYNLARCWVEERIDGKCQELGLYIYYQTDPRGATIYLNGSNSMTQSDYNRDGVCIY